MTLAYDERIVGLTEFYTEQDEEVLTYWEARLAAGYPRFRLMNEAGMGLDDLEWLLMRANPTRPLVSGVRKSLERLAILKAKETKDETETPCAKTYVFDFIRSKLMFAHGGEKHGGRLVVISGDVGIGKSVAATAYAAEHPKTYSKRGVLYILLTAIDNKPVTLLERINDALPNKKGNFRGTKHMLLELARLLGRGDLVILDEANYLLGGNSRVLDVVRDLWTQTGAGFALIGNHDLNTGLSGNEYEALGSRAFRFPFYREEHERERNSMEFLQWRGVEDPESRARLLAIGKQRGRSGGIRAIENVLELIDSAGLPYTPTAIEAAKKQIGLS